MKNNYIKSILKSDSVAELSKNVAEFTEALKNMDDTSAESQIRMLKESLSILVEKLKESTKKPYIVATGNNACMVLLARVALLDGCDTKEAMIQYLNLWQLHTRLSIDVSEELISKAENRKKANEIKKILGYLDKWCGYSYKVHPDEKILILKFSEYGCGINGVCNVAEENLGFGRIIMLFEMKNMDVNDHNPVFTLVHELGHDVMFCLSESKSEHRSIIEELSGIDFSSADDEVSDEEALEEDFADIIAIGILHGSEYEEYIRNDYWETLDYYFMGFLSDVTFNLLDLCESKTGELDLKE